MAARKKAKGKGTAKRKKTPRTKVATRKKTTLAGRTKKIRKKAPKKPPLRRASAKKAKPIAKAVDKPTPISPPAQVTAVRPTPSPPTQPAPPGERIGVVTHYYSHLSVATVRLASGTLRLGDMIHVRGHTTDFRSSPSRLIVRRRPKWGRMRSSA